MICVKRNGLGAAALGLLAATVQAQTTPLATGIMDYVLPLVCGVFNGIFWLAGSIGAVIIVYSGIRYVTSMDDPGVRKKAKETLLHAIVGLALLLIVAVIVGVATNFELEACAVMQRP